MAERQAEPAKAERTPKPGYYNDLLMPVSILVAIQVALAISLAEQEKLDSSWNIFLIVVIVFTLALLGWSFTGHTLEKRVIGLEEVRNARKEKQSYYILVIVMLCLTLILIGGYLIEFS